MNLRSPSRVAVVSDIHGNRWALESVLQDIDRRGIRHVVNLGDSLYGPIDSAGTAAILVRRPMPTVRGNEDRIITEGDVETPLVRFVRAALDNDHYAWLEGLSGPCPVFETMFACHGTPERDDAYLLHVVTPSGSRRREVDELADTLPSVDADVVLCGHDHTPRQERLPDGRLVVNPGSVGLQAYTDDEPFPHAMETGTPNARYAVLEKSRRGWQARDITVTYDWKSAAVAAERNGYGDWARRLETGLASPQSST